MPKKMWEICGYDSDKKIFETYAPIGYFSERQIQELLKALVAKAGLTFDEIVGAYAKRSTKASNTLLSINKEGPYPQYMCGPNPYFVARIVERE